MSRIGRKPISIPAQVKVEIKDGDVFVQGPKGKLQMRVHPRIKVHLKENFVLVERATNINTDRALHGLTRSLIQNMVRGVSEGYTKELEIEGVGYRAQVSGKKLTLSVGYSHPVEYMIPDGIEIKCPKPTQIVVSGVDRQKVGQTAAEIRGIREPEPYKGKGIRYAGEVIHRKQGKTTA